MQGCLQFLSCTHRVTVGKLLEFALRFKASGVLDLRVVAASRPNDS